jgi:hypothetical protein
LSVAALVSAAIVVAALCGSCSDNQSDSGPAEPDSATLAALRVELEERMVEDQKYRLMLDSVQTQFGADSEEMMDLWDKQVKIDSANMARLEEIVEQFGWPGASMVGDQAATAAFLILQHADYVYQKKYLALVKEEAAKGEISPAHAAMLEDRVLMHEGKNQIYGTQLQRDPVTGELWLYPVEDEINVDKRRAEVGLMPIADYLRYFGLEYAPPDTSVVDSLR